MFTGLIQDVGRLRSVEQRQGGGVLKIETQLDMSDWELGESIAVLGACLTVTQMSAPTFSVDCSPETLRRTTLGRLSVGSSLHLERAMRLGDRFGGHIVSGHVDGVGEVVQTGPEGNAWIISIRPPAELMRYMIEKGSVCVDGVSLTINTLNEVDFSLAIIPHTVEKTRLGKLRAGDQVNLEVDMVGKYIERLVRPWKEGVAKASGIDEDFLKKHGFS